MVKLNLVLVLALVACAVSVVSARHQARRLFVALQAEQAHGREFDTDWGRLQLEIATWLTHNRVGDVARDRLGMVMPEGKHVFVLRKETQP